MPGAAAPSNSSLQGGGGGVGLKVWRFGQGCGVNCDAGDDGQSGIAGVRIGKALVGGIAESNPSRTACSCHPFHLCLPPTPSLPSEGEGGSRPESVEVWVGMWGALRYGGLGYSGIAGERVGKAMVGGKSVAVNDNQLMVFGRIAASVPSRTACSCHPFHLCLPPHPIPPLGGGGGSRAESVAVWARMRGELRCGGLGYSGIAGERFGKAMVGGKSVAVKDNQLMVFGGIAASVPSRTACSCHLSISVAPPPHPSPRGGRGEQGCDGGSAAEGGRFGFGFGGVAASDPSRTASGRTCHLSLPSPHPVPPHKGEGGDGLLWWVCDLECGSAVFRLGLFRGLLADKKRGGLHAARSIVLRTGTS